MVGIRSISVAVLAMLLAGAGAGFAVADPPPWAHIRGQSPGEARAHAVITGTVVGINYAVASILVATPHGLVPVAVTPSTSIYRGSGFASFADLGRGAHVEIDASDLNGRLVAQIIRIR